MGQRHQLFVIAKVNGRYRGLSAIHHQWLYGFTAIKQCHRLLKIFQAPENRIALHHELESAQQRDDAFWNTEPSYRQLDLPFPFITTCLVLGASFNPDAGYEHSVSILPFNMQYDDGDNNDGITVIDISQLGHTRYCFVDFHGIESEKEVCLNTALSARTYLEAYYDPELKWQAEYDKELEGVQSFELIQTKSLQEAWPIGEWNTEHSDSYSHRTLSPEPTSSSIRTLADTSLQVLIDNALEAQPEDDLAWIPDAELVQEFLPALRLRLYQTPHSSVPAVTCRLLCRALQGQSHVDLSPFTSLSPKEIVKVVTEVRRNKDLISLDLSNLDIAEDTLKEILEMSPCIQQLYIMNSPKLTIESATLPVRAPDIRDVYHADIFKHAFRTETDGASEDNPFQSSGIVHNPIVQLLWAHGDPGQINEKGMRFDNGGADWSNLATGPTGSNAQIGVFPLIDTHSSPVKTITGMAPLFNFVTNLTHAMSYSNIPDYIGETAAKAFALASSKVPCEESLQVGPLSAKLYKKSGYLPRQHKFDKLYEMQPGQWTIIVVYEKVESWSSGDAQSRINYAFLTPAEKLAQESNDSPWHAPGQFVIADVSQYLEKSMRGKVEPGLKEYWDKAMRAVSIHLDSSKVPDSRESPSNTISVCSEEEVVSLLQRYPRELSTVPATEL